MGTNLSVTNFDAVSAATVILVIVTLYYAWQTRRLVIEARRSLEQTTRATVVPSLLRRGGFIVLLVQNYGSRPAFKVRLGIPGGLDKRKRQAVGARQFEYFDKHPVSVLAPNAQVFRDLNAVGAVNEWKLEASEKLDLDVTVSYFDGYADRTETIRLDFEDSLASAVQGVGTELEMDPLMRVAHAVERLSEPGIRGSTVLSSLLRIADAVERQAPPR